MCYTLDVYYVFSPHTCQADSAVTDKHAVHSLLTFSLLDRAACHAEVLVQVLLSYTRCTKPCLLLQLVIFLYLLDSETSYVVIASSGIGTVIEFWKVTKAMNVTIDRSRGYPMIKFEDKAGERAAT